MVGMVIWPTLSRDFRFQWWKFLALVLICFVLGKMWWSPWTRSSLRHRCFSKQGASVVARASWSEVRPLLRALQMLVRVSFLRNAVLNMFTRLLSSTKRASTKKPLYCWTRARWPSILLSSAVMCDLNSSTGNAVAVAVAVGEGEVRLEPWRVGPTRLEVLFYRGSSRAVLSGLPCVCRMAPRRCKVTNMYNSAFIWSPCTRHKNSTVIGNMTYIGDSRTNSVCIIL